MAKHTIIISDEDVGISIRVQRTGIGNASLAGIVTSSILNWIQKNLPAAEKKAALFGTCTCDGCKTARAKVATAVQPTIH